MFHLAVETGRSTRLLSYTIWEYIVIRTNKKESVRKAYVKNAVHKVKFSNQSTLLTVGNQERSLLRGSLRTPNVPISMFQKAC